MAYQVLARKWRPSRFSELVGQEHVVTAISNALDNNRLHHAYLFTGTRGVGKTTIARIFSKSLNCETGLSANPCGECHTCKDIENGSFVDLLEIDAASRTKVEDTRELLDNVQYKPTRGQYKVYLIDEVHMLSKHSFNALLKTLEEPPPHVKFLLATTDPQKLPVTILSRCLQFNLKALSRDQITQQLSFILEQESIPFDQQAIAQLARAAQGSMRDALSLTDQAIAQGNGHVSNAIVTDMLGLMDKSQILKLVHNVFSNQAEQVMQQVEELTQQSTNYEQVLVEVMSLLHQVAMTQYVPEVCKLETVTARAIFQLAKMLPAEQVQLAYQIALQGKKDMAYAADGRVGLEMTLLRMLAFNPSPLDLSIDETNALSGEGTYPAASKIPQHANPTSSDKQDSQLLTDLNEQQNDILEQAESLSEKQPTHANLSTLKNEIAGEEVNRIMPSDASAEADAVSADAFDHSNVQDVSFHDSEFSGSNVEQSNLADFHQQTMPEEQVSAPQHDEIVPVDTRKVEESVTTAHSTASLIALKNQLAQKEVASEVAEDTAKKSEADSFPQRLKRASSIQSDEPENGAAEQTQGPSPEQPAQALVADNAMEEEPDVALLAARNQHLSVSPESPDPAELPDSGPSGSTTQPDNAPVKTQQTIDPVDVNVDLDLDGESEAPPWESTSQQIDSQTIATVPQNDDSQSTFDPMAHLNDPVEVEVDFDVPVFLSTGEKVTLAEQLDTWSQLVEQLQLTALTKQLALHSAYDKNGNQVHLKLLDSKPHLDTESARAQLKDALSTMFQQEIELQVTHTQPKNTPFAVQQAINQARLQHAQKIAQTDENIQRVKSVFSGNIVENTIKPR
jgi:DNA polymerase-3 subunit gamma/tau